MSHIWAFFEPYRDGKHAATLLIRPYNATANAFIILHGTNN